MVRLSHRNSRGIARGILKLSAVTACSWIGGRGGGQFCAKAKSKGHITLDITGVVSKPEHSTQVNSMAMVACSQEESLERCLISLSVPPLGQEPPGT